MLPRRPELDDLLLDIEDGNGGKDASSIMWQRIANSLKQWLIMLLLVTVKRSSCDIAADIMEASVVSDDVGKVVFNSSVLRPEKSLAVNCITVEWVLRSNTVVEEFVNKREQSSKISNAGVENVLTSVLLYKEVCMEFYPLLEPIGVAKSFCSLC